SEELSALAELVGWRGLRVAFPEPLKGLARIHPIRYAGLLDGLSALLLEDVAPIESLPEAPRWAHLVDKLYDAAVPPAATGSIAPGEVCPQSGLDAPSPTQCHRFRSRLEELGGQGVAPAVALQTLGAPAGWPASEDPRRRDRPLRRPPLGPQPAPRHVVR